MCFYGSEGMGLRADNLKVHCLVAAWEWPSYMSPEAFEKGINIKVEVKKIKLKDVIEADELFFTGTAAEVVPIRSVDKKLISDGERGKITTILQKNYFDQVRGKRNSFSDWLYSID